MKTETEYPDGHYCIVHDNFNKNLHTMLNVINNGHVVNNIISFYTQDGKFHQKNVNDVVDGATEVIHIDKIDIRGSLYYWYKENKENYQNSKKPLIRKDISKGEIYTKYGWAYKLMLASDEENVYYNFIFE